MNHLANAVAILNRAAIQRQLSATITNTKLNRACLYKLTKLGFVRGFNLLQEQNKLLVFLRFNEQGSPTMSTIKLLSKSGHRSYVKYHHLLKSNLSENISSDNNSILIISTSLGLLTASEAILHKRGGEVLFKVI